MVACCCCSCRQTPPMSQKTLFEALGLLRASRLSPVHRDLALRGRDHAVLFPWFGPVHDGPRHFRQGRARRDGDGPGDCRPSPPGLPWDLAVTYLGFKWTLVLGAGSWLLLYVIYVVGLPRIVLVVGPGLARPGLRDVHHRDAKSMRGKIAAERIFRAPCKA